MTKGFRSVLGKTYLISASLLVLFCAPSAAFADTPPATSSTDPSSTASSTTDSTASTDPSSTAEPSSSSSSSSNNSSQNQQGPTTPPGPASSTYTYDASTGLWTNGYYAWNPTTGQTTPLTPQTYSYNPSTGMWDTTQYVYSPASGTYQPNVKSVAQPPAGASTSDTSTPQNTTTPTNNSSVPTSTVNPDGTTNTGLFDNFYNATISNNISSDATSGDALVVGNTTGGSAVSGNALDLANVINMVQSSSGLGTGDVATFIDNIMGDVQGNLVIDPRLLQGATDPNVADNLTVNDTTNAQIDNNIALNAGSGDATVADNTTGGDATSGNAEAVANVVNMINSIIAAHQSFFGVVNIYGNLTGNVIVPSDLLNSLLATNGSASTDPSNTTTTLNSTTDQAINNQVNTDAQSGQATVADNTTGGNATTGSANTNVTVFNLTGSQIVGCNSMLVFVNVLGQWVGFIMNAPAGTTAAALGGGCATSYNTSGNTDVTNNTNDQINNNVTANAQTGDASVNHNTTAGNATSGNASASVNLLNLENSDFSLSNWFGVLFINVFGNWIGSVEGSDSLSTPTSTSSDTTTTPPSNGIRAAGVFSFIPTGSGSSTNNFSLASAAAGQNASSSTGSSQSKTTALVSYTTGSDQSATVAHVNAPANTFRLSVLPLAIGMLGLGTLGVEQFRSVRRRHIRNNAATAILSQLNED